MARGRALRTSAHPGCFLPKPTLAYLLKPAPSSPHALHPQVIVNGELEASYLDLKRAIERCLPGTFAPDDLQDLPPEEEEATPAAGAEAEQDAAAPADEAATPEEPAPAAEGEEAAPPAEEAATPVSEVPAAPAAEAEQEPAEEAAAAPEEDAAAPEEPAEAEQEAAAEGEQEAEAVEEPPQAVEGEQEAAPSAEEAAAPTAEQGESVESIASRISSLLVISGPSGVGKGTLINKLMVEHGAKFGFSVSHTTRGPRPGEEDGVHYHFVERVSW